MNFRQKMLVAWVKDTLATNSFFFSGETVPSTREGRKYEKWLHGGNPKDCLYLINDLEGYIKEFGEKGEEKFTDELLEQMQTVLHHKNVRTRKHYKII